MDEPTDSSDPDDDDDDEGPSDPKRRKTTTPTTKRTAQDDARERQKAIIAAVSRGDKETVRQITQDSDKAAKKASAQRAEKYRDVNKELQKKWNKVLKNRALVQEEMHRKATKSKSKSKPKPTIKHLLSSLSPDWSKFWEDRANLHRKMKQACLKPSFPFQKSGQEEIIRQQKRERELLKQASKQLQEEEEEEEDSDQEGSEQEGSEQEGSGDEGSGDEGGSGEEEEEGDVEDAPAPKKRKKRSAHFVVISDGEGEDEPDEIVEITTSELRQMQWESKKYREMVAVMSGTQKKRKRVAQTHVSNQDTVCNHCNVNFFDNSRLKRHLKVLNKEKTAKYTCKEKVVEKGVEKECGAKFMNKHDSKEHKKWHDMQDKGEDAPFYCGCCKQIFKSDRALKKHKENEASKKREKDEGAPRPFQCKYCKSGGRGGLGFHKKDACTEHEKGCPKNKKRKPMYCEFCGLAKYRLKDLNKHEESCGANPENIDSD